MRRRAAAAHGAVPAALAEQLAPGGRLVAPVEDADGEQHLALLRKHGGVLQRTRLDRVRFVPLVASGPG